MSYLWDVFRPAITAAESADVMTRSVVLLLALGMFLIAILAYRKSPSKRLLLIAGAFFLFALKSALKIIDVFISPGMFFADPSDNFFEMAILLMFFFAIFRK